MTSTDRVAVVTGASPGIGEATARALDPADVAATSVFAASRLDHVELPEITVNTTDKLA